MSKEHEKQQARETWIKIYKQVGSVSKAARKCGIARSTMHRWVQRFEPEGLNDRTRRPHRLAHQKWDEEVENLVLEARDSYRYGKIRICSHLWMHHQVKISASTVARILKKYNRPFLKRYRKQVPFIRYAKDIPGERVQMDVCKIASGIYHYTAIDDCSRFRVLYTYSRRTAKNSMDFLERIVEQMPFPIQRIQTDRGQEFLLTAFSRNLGSTALNSDLSSPVLLI
jgi:transposase